MPAGARERIEACCRSVPEVIWSVSIRRGNMQIAEVDPDRVLRIASLGKIPVLMAASERIAADPAFATRALARPSDPVADSGLWQHLSMPTITVADACVLVGSVSDNLSTNALIDALGLDACNAVARRAGHADVTLHDIVRDLRLPGQPDCLAEGSARGVLALLAVIADPGAGHARVRDWLALGVDHSMAMGAIGADPLSPGAVGEPSHAHKTGSDPGVRADAGLIGPDLEYALLANFSPDRVAAARVVRVMRDILSIALDD